MGKKEYLVFVLNESFLFVDLAKNQLTEISFPISPIPYVPFYHYLYELEVQKEIGKSFFSIIFEKLGLPQKPHGGMFNFIELYIVIPDDTLQVDKRILEDYFFMYIGRKITIIEQNMLISTQETDYLSISQTVRSYVFAYIKGGYTKVKKFYPSNQIFDIETIKKEIDYLHEDCRTKNFPIFINNLSKNTIPQNIGISVEIETFLKNWNFVKNNMKKK